jgi:hypothetical protein
MRGGQAGHYATFSTSCPPGGNQRSLCGDIVAFQLNGLPHAFATRAPASPSHGAACSPFLRLIARDQSKASLGEATAVMSSNRRPSTPAVAIRSREGLFPVSSKPASADQPPRLPRVGVSLPQAALPAWRALGLYGPWRSAGGCGAAQENPMCPLLDLQDD